MVTNQSGMFIADILNDEISIFDNGNWCFIYFVDMTQTVYIKLIFADENFSDDEMWELLEVAFKIIKHNKREIYLRMISVEAKT